MWMSIQAMYDLANAERQRRKLKLKPQGVFINELPGTFCMDLFRRIVT